ncbi:DUF883 family protein [Collimonas silvisoli]|uniref:DUF883 family protein n=1 Tax=Collimonas silvisoli TaxID=2825884 RepID=UPI001B8CA1E1|nr:DUF883 family protein [Collimonas silvisoli]
MRDNLAGELKSVIKEAETLLDDTNDHAEKRYNSAREKLKTALDTAKTELPKVTKKAVEKTKYAAHVTDEYVGGNPWKAVSVAAAIGLLAGVVIGRSK